MRREGITDDGYISGNTINTYLNEFARDFDLVRRTKLSTKVVKVERISAAPNSGWRLALAESLEAIECRKLIYASGATSHPVMPTWPTSPKFSSTIIHSSAIGTHLDTLSTVRKAVVVGAAKSAYDTVFLLLSNGIQVEWIIREDGTGPLAIMPPTILGVLNSMDVISTRAMAALGSSIMSIHDPGYQFFQKNRVGRFFALSFWRTVTWIAERHAGYSRSPDAQKLRPLPHGNGIFWANAGLGCASVPDFWKVFHEGNCTVHRTEIASFDSGKALTLLNGEKLQTDFVILCTGFDKSYHQFDSALQAELGLAPDPAPEAREKWTPLDARAETVVDDLLPALATSPVPPSKHEILSSEGSEASDRPLHGPSLHYRRLIVPSLAAKGDRSIIFPGFIHSIYTPLVSEVQALWGVAFLLGLNEVPSQVEMEVEVATWRAWCRKRYLAQGRKHAYAIFDFIPVSPPVLMHDTEN
jgi:hypothetical protein